MALHGGKHNTQGMGVRGRVTEHAVLGPFETCVNAQDRVGSRTVQGILREDLEPGLGNLLLRKKASDSDWSVYGEKARKKHPPGP